jgi:glycosyltransferase involved in cell wall biosynthesis
MLLRRRLSGVHSISTYVRDVVRRDFLDGCTSGTAEVVLPSFAEDASHGERDGDPFLAPYLDQLPDEPFLMFVGALRLEKGLRPLLAAYAALDAPPPLVLIGTLEPDTPDFPPGVIVLRDFPHAAVMAAWRRCLFGVVPSLWPEPLGSVVYEGMLAGKAMIGTIPGGHSDMIEDGVSGLLVAAGDVAGLAGAMRRLIEDPESREAFGRVASDRASRFTAPWVVPRLERFYRDRIAIRAGVESR